MPFMASKIPQPAASAMLEMCAQLERALPAVAPTATQEAWTRIALAGVRAFLEGDTDTDGLRRAQYSAQRPRQDGYPPKKAWRFYELECATSDLAGLAGVAATWARCDPRRLAELNRVVEQVCANASAGAWWEDGADGTRMRRSVDGGAS